MPVVTTQTSVKAVAKPKALDADTILQAELEAYIPVFKEFVTLSKQLNNIKKNYEAMSLKMLVSATGIKNEDGIKAMDPESLAKLVNDRLLSGALKCEHGEYDIEITPSQPNGRQTVSWQDVVKSLKGEDYVKELQASAPKSFSYKVIPTNANGSHILD